MTRRNLCNDTGRDASENDRVSLERYLKELNIRYEDISEVTGPTYTLYKIRISAGEKVSRIRNCQEDISLHFGRTARIVVLPDSVGVELTNKKNDRKVVSYSGLPAEEQGSGEIPVTLGVSVEGDVVVEDLTQMPHLLIAGAPKQGITNAFRVMMVSMVRALPPEKLSFAIFDPKSDMDFCRCLFEKGYLALRPDYASSVEEEKEHCIAGDETDALSLLSSLEKEMEDRYGTMSSCSVRNMERYHSKYESGQLKDRSAPYYPYIVAVIDEFADYTNLCSVKFRNQLRDRIIRLAQKGRAAGIHVIMATQRPSMDVLSGLVKANFPSRLAFRTASRIDSAAIIDCSGAEMLCGCGDALYTSGLDSTRIQVPYLPEEEFEEAAVCRNETTGIKAPYYLPQVPVEGVRELQKKEMMLEAERVRMPFDDYDPKLEEAALIILASRTASVSILQRKLSLGFARACRIMDQLEDKGIVGVSRGVKPREILIDSYDELEKLLRDSTIVS